MDAAMKRVPVVDDAVNSTDAVYVMSSQMACSSWKGTNVDERDRLAGEAAREDRVEDRIRLDLVGHGDQRQPRSRRIRRLLSLRRPARERAETHHAQRDECECTPFHATHVIGDVNAQLKPRREMA